MAGAIPLAVSLVSSPALAQVQDTSQPDQAAKPADTSLDIVVTAQKREQRLQDVPMPVSVLQADTLSMTNQTQISDYFNKVPGLNLANAGIYGGSVISIRGITSSVFNDGTTNVIIDDVPYMSAAASGPGEIVPEIDPGDLERVEVLRGPQGTLYGASSLGGLLKYVTIPPELGKFEGYLRGGVFGVRNGPKAGYSLSGGINAPLGDTLALRVSGFTRSDPGYIDDPVHGIKGVNRARTSGGRASLLWQPIDGVSVKLGAVFEDGREYGNGYVNILPGNTGPVGLTQNTVPHSGGVDRQLQVYTADIRASLGGVDFASISSYAYIKSNYLFDLTDFLGGFAESNFGVGGATSENAGVTRRYTQELRATIPLGDKASLLAGVFYANEQNTREQDYYAADTTTGARIANFGFINFPSTFEEKAVFADLTYNFTDRFNIQVGGRFAANRQTLPTYSTGGLLFGGGVSQAEVESKDSAFTYLVSPQFKVSRDLMIYARLASGYRPGGPNINTAADSSIPVAYKPDRTYNYELGVKGSTFDGILSFDASLYYIDWKSLKLGSLVSRINRLNYIDNANDAKSEGVDLTLTLKPARGTTLSGWAAYNVAELTQDFPTNSTLYGATGDRLPFSSRFSSSASFDQVIDLTSSAKAYFGGTISYVGRRVGPFTNTAVRQNLPAYTTVDLRAGIRSGGWDASIYVNNLTDSRGLLLGPIGAFVPNTYVYTRPRVIGASVQAHF